MKQIKHIVIDYIYILIGSAITGLGITLFTTPAKIAPGGVSGIATILYHLFGFDVGTSILFLSIPIFLIGIKLFGKRYGLNSLVGTIALSLFTSIWCRIFGYDGVLDYSKEMSVWLSCLYGGVLCGLGIGIVLKSGSNTGGTDIVALILARYTHIPTGTALLIVDGFIIAISAFVFSLESALFAIIVSYIISIVINKIVISMGTGYAKTAFIISESLDQIGDFIINNLDRSATIVKAKGLYSGEEKPVLMVVLPNYSISELVRFVHKVDKNAFMTILDTHQVLGEGFTPMEKMIEIKNNDVTSNINSNF